MKKPLENVYKWARVDFKSSTVHFIRIKVTCYLSEAEGLNGVNR